jgi:hypothetical protein
MVLKAPDYGFIGLKLKDLIFPERYSEHTGVDIQQKGGFTPQNTGWKLIV